MFLPIPSQTLSCWGWSSGLLSESSGSVESFAALCVYSEMERRVPLESMGPGPIVQGTASLPIQFLGAPYDTHSMLSIPQNLIIILKASIF